MELEEWIPLLAVVSATILGSLTYVWQKYVDRKEALIALRQQEYNRFLNDYINAISDESPQSLAIYHQAFQRLFVVGSDEVIRTTGALNNSLASTSGRPRSSKEIDEIQHLLVEMYKAMRNDCFEKTQITDDELRQLSPFENSSHK